MKKIFLLLLVLSLCAFSMFSCIKRGNENENENDNGGEIDNGEIEEDDGGLLNKDNIDPDGWTKVDK